MLLPNPQWLQKNGYNGLYRTMYKHRELFTHIPQERKHKTIEEHVATAESLAEKNGGILQKTNWLRGNGYEGLVQALYNHPDAFTHISRTFNHGRSLEENIALAESLAEKNDGHLQNSKWLIENGYNGLQIAIQRNRDVFSHVLQVKKYKTLAEQICIAEILVNESGGTLPNHASLRKSHHSLVRAMSKHPKAFKHIKQLRLNTTGNPI